MKLLTVDLEVPLPAVPPHTCGEQWVLVRLHGEPLGVIFASPDGCTPEALARLVLQEHGCAVAGHLAGDGLTVPTCDELSRIPPSCPRPQPTDWPSVTVAVCTRGRATQLSACLSALAALDYPPHLLDIVIVDNAPADDATRRVVNGFAAFRYVVEPAGGLDRARNRAIQAARGEIIAYTDDDVSVDPGWVRALAAAFVEEPAAMCVTGLVMPDEVDTEAQILFERYGGFGRGFERQVFGVDVAGGERVAPRFGGTGRFGTGANMAFRRRFFKAAGGFDPWLDVGTPANGGGDLEIFFRVLQTGGLLVYEPAALVRHRHRRDRRALAVQITNNGVGFYSYLVRTARAYPAERAAIVRLGLWWLWWWNIRRLLLSCVGRAPVPHRLMLAELKGSLLGLFRYKGTAARHEVLP